MEKNQCSYQTMLIVTEFGRKVNRYMKNENGAGSVYKRSGKHHRPWLAVVTLGYKTDGKKSQAIRKYIGSYATRTEAMDALAVYRKNPILPNQQTATFEEIYNKWWDGYKDQVSTTRNITAGYGYLEKIHKAVFADLRPAHYEDALKGYNYNAQKRAKTVLNHVYNYALKNDIIDKNYGALTDISAKEEVLRDRQPFTYAEIQKLWEHEGELIADMILIAIYSGWRPAELFDYRIDDISGCMVGGSKTEAGTDRVVPIHPDIRELVYKYRDGFQFGYNWYWDNFKRFTASLGMDHIPHETRHTFVTVGKLSGIDEYILKRIVGHSVRDMTEAVYTHRSVETLKAEMAKWSVSNLSATSEQRTQKMPV